MGVARRAVCWLVWCGLCAAGCDGPSASGADAALFADAAAPRDASVALDAAVTQDAALAADAAVVTDAARTWERTRCVVPAGAPSAPRSIAEVVSVLNALPKPVSLACFLDVLPRPLAIHAVNSVFSAQPAQGRHNPRLFVFIDSLILSVVLAGVGAPLLEFGEVRSDTHTLKGELEFPITGALDAAAPYERLRFDDTLTTCGFCHQGEVADPEVDLPFAKVSPALRPMPQQRVPLSELHAALGTCDLSATPERCAMLDALFGPEPAPVERDFPETFKTFF